MVVRAAWFVCIELLYLDAAEAAMAFDIERFGTVGMLGVAFALHAGKGGFDVVLDADVLIDTDLNAAEATVECDDSAVHDVGITQVEADETKAGMHLGAFKALTVVAVFMFAEAHVDFVHLAAIQNNGLCLADGMAMAAILLAEEQQRYAPYHGHKAYHVFPDVGPEDDIACRQEQQDTDAETDDGSCLVAVVEDIDKARHDDEEGPPSFEAYANQSKEFQGPHDSEGYEGNAADDFTCAIHFPKLWREASRSGGASLGFVVAVVLLP